MIPCSKSGDHDESEVTLGHAKVKQNMGETVGIAFKIRIAMLDRGFSCPVDGDECGFIGLKGAFGHDVEGEVKIVGDF